ncbi:hypothetical protein PV10_05268 [Exophiala mesophila]|uniref:Uncharacterized protein n=1 Tax=Exophiala mesophila TaxID=212818 RepID=A0A0D1WXI6_EXOME|nr:uncharacterized protein PV10_05268 [Exophiala mesophila]KIV94115.1 hypothetical protein PV10_05268 [Exophiala mesophila]
MDPGLDSQQTSDESDEVAKTCKLLHATMKRMRTRDRLSGRSPRLVREAVDILKTPQTGRDNLVYQEFLCDVLHNCGRGVTLLCAASLGKFRVVRLQEKDKIGLIDHLKDNLINFQHSFLEALAKAHEIPSAYDLAKGVGKHQCTKIPSPKTPKWLTRSDTRPYRTDVRNEDLIKFLQDHSTEYPILVITAGKNEMPSIELSLEMGQNLIIHIMEREKARIDLSTRAGANI